jgi:hypothetical protein
MDIPDGIALTAGAFSPPRTLRSYGTVRLGRVARRRLVDHGRISGWENTFAEMFRVNVERPYHELIVRRLYEFAWSLDQMSAPPDRSGNAQGRRIDKETPATDALAGISAPQFLSPSISAAAQCSHAVRLIPRFFAEASTRSSNTGSNRILTTTFSSAPALVAP